MQIHTNKYQTVCRRNDSELKKRKKILVTDSCVALRLKQYSNGKIMTFDEMFYILYTPHKFQKTRK